VVVGAEGRERERGISGVLGLRIESMRDPRVEGGREGGRGWTCMGEGRGFYCMQWKGYVNPE
jgi:hypothetical protein